MIHVWIASWTALDRSPFLPPNRSTVFILSCFSISSLMSTLMRPNSVHLFLLVTCFCNKRAAIFFVLFLFVSYVFPMIPLIHISI